MSIADTLLSIKQHIQAAYSAINIKGGIIPANKNLANLSAAIETITGGGGGGVVDNLAKLLSDSFTSEDQIDYSNLSITSINAYLFYSCTSLVNMPKFPVTESGIYCGEHAFAYTYNLKSPEPVTLKLSGVGQYAFYNSGKDAASSSSNNNIDYVFNNASINRYAFQYCKYRSLKGSVRPINAYNNSYGWIFAWSNTSQHLCEEIDLVMNSLSCAGYMFYNACPKKMKVTGAPGGYNNYESYMFYNVGQNTRYRDGSPYILDFSKACAYQGTTNMFGYLRNTYVYLHPGTYQNSSSWFSSSTDLCVFLQENFLAQSKTIYGFSTSSSYRQKMFVDYEWFKEWHDYFSNYSSIMYTWIKNPTTTVLPTHTKDGFACTWYSDPKTMNASTAISSATIGEPVYASVTKTVSAAYVEYVNTFHCSIEITDGVNTYSQGDFIPLNATVTINITPESGYSNIMEFTLNGVSLTDGDTYTVTDGTRINIQALCWSSSTLILDSTFENNTLEDIYLAGLFNCVPNDWSVGDTKEIMLPDDEYTYHLRIADKKRGRYQCSENGHYNSIVLEIVELPKIDTKNLGGYQVSFCITYQNSNGDEYNTSYTFVKGNDCLDILPNELKNIIKSYYAYVGTARAANYSKHDFKIIVPSFNELGFNLSNWANLSSETLSMIDNTNFGAYEYYADNDASKRIKTKNDAAAGYYVRSPWNYDTSHGYVTTSGATGSTSSTNIPYFFAL